MKKFSWLRAVAFALMLFLATGGALCQRTVIRDGVRVPAEQAEKSDLAEGDRAFAAGRFDDAIAAYYRLLSDFPRSDHAPHAMVRIGECYVKKGDCDAAATYLREVISRYPRASESADAAYLLAECARKKGDCDAAINLCEAHRQNAKGKRWDEMTMLMGACAEEKKNHLNAVQYYAQVAKQGHDDGLKKKARARAGEVMSSLSDDDLLFLANDSPDAFPGDAALMELTRRSMETENYDKALEYANRIQTSYPKSAFLADLRELLDMIKRRVGVKSRRIGLALPLSGRYGPLGEQALQGAMLAASVFGADEGEEKFELVIKDTGAEGVKIEDLIEGLIKNEQVIAIVGPMVKSRAEAAANRAEALSVPMISLSPGDDFCGLGEWIYQNSLGREEQVRALVEYAVTERKISNFGVLYPNNSYGAECKNLFVRELKARGLGLEQAEAYDLHDAKGERKTDFKDEIKAFKGSRVKALFIPDTYDRVIMIAPQLRYYLQTQLPLMGINSWHSSQLLTSTQPDDLTNAFFTDGFAPEASRPLFLEFTRNFHKQYQRQPGPIEAQAYEAIDLLTHLIKTYKIKDRIQLKYGLDHVKDYPGVTGVINIDGCGKFVKPIYLFTIKDRAFTVEKQYD